MLSCHDNTSGRGDPPNPRTPAVRKEAARHLVEGWREDLAGGIPRTPARQPCARRPPDIWSRAGARISPGGSPEPPHASRAQGGRPTFGRGLARGSRPAPERASGPRWARRMPTAPGGSSGRCARPPRSGLRDAERPERPKPWRPLRLRGVTGGTAPRQPCGHPRNPPRAPPETAVAGPSRASSSTSWSPASQTARANRPTRHSLATAALSPRRPLSALPVLPVPLGDRRSSLSGDPTTRRLPETPPSSPGVASEPVVQVKVRFRRPLSGPRGRLPSRS